MKKLFTKLGYVYVRTKTKPQIQNIQIYICDKKVRSLWEGEWGPGRERASGLSLYGLVPHLPTHPPIMQIFALYNH